MEYLNKTVIITGAASGMGLLCGKCFAEEGANVVMTDINKEALDEKVAEINALGKGKAIGVQVDVRDYAQVCKARDAAIENFGSIDIMINMAGGAEIRMLKSPVSDFKDVPIEVYDWSIDVNLKGTLYFNHAVMPQMVKQQSGVIINTGSITGEEGSAGNIGYAISKSGIMNGMTKSLAQYGANHGIRCCCVAPGPVLTRAAMANMKTMTGKAAQPMEIVNMIMYLTSDKAVSITGTTYFIDGGRAASGHDGNLLKKEV